MPVSLEDPDRLRALALSGLMGSEPEAEFDWITRLISRLLDAPVSMITLVDDQRQFFKSSVGLPVRETPLQYSFCQHVVRDQAPLIVSDARSDPRISENPALRDLGLIAYLGVPLTTSEGHTLGSLCAVDSCPRAWTDEDLEILTDLAQGVVSGIELRTLSGKLVQEQRALRDSSEQLALTLENAPIGMAVVGLDGRFEQVNRALCEITGYPQDELLELTFQSITHADDLDADVWHVEELLAGRASGYQVQKRYTRRDGSEIWVRLSVSLVRGAAGEPRYFIRQVEDITAARAAQEALADSEALLSAVIENVPAGIMVRDLEGRYRRGNAYAAATLGITPDEVPGGVPEEFFSERAAREIREHDARVLERGEPVAEEVTVARADGEERIYQVVKYPVRDHSGSLIGLGSFSLDITAQKHAERDLRESEQKLHDAQALANFGSWELDPEVGRLRWSDELCRIAGQPSGYSPTYEEFIAIVHPDDREQLRGQVRTAWEGSFSDSEYRIVRPDGEVRFVHTRRFGRADETGRVVELWGTTQDVTERVQSEQELRSARERSQAIIAGMREGYALTVGGQIVEVNDALCQLTGFDRDELIGSRSPFPFWPPHLREQTRALVARVIEQEGGTFELTMMRKDGSLFEGEITAHPARNPDGTVLGFVNTLRDISEAKGHRIELEREREALREAQQAARLGSWDYDLISDQPGKWSTEMWRMLALEPQEAAPPLPDFAAMIHPDDRERVLARIAATLQAHEPLEEEFWMTAADGHELRVAFQAHATRDDEGRLVMASGTIQDITERANREAEEVAVREIAQLVAQAAEPAAVFEHVAREACTLFKGHSGVVVRFDEEAGHAVFINAFARDGSDLAGTVLDLTGTSAPAAVYRTGVASRTGGAPSSGYRPSFAKVVAEISDAVAAPITVGGRLWGCLAAGFQGEPAPPDTEQRLSRFAELVGMAIANAEALSKLSHEASTDGLTGLANQRVFKTALATEVGRARRYARDLALVLFDLDHFKRVNDRHGHQVGDKVLAEFARRLSQEAREGELLARVGGEEFAWLMPETDLQAAYRAAERIRRTIEGQPFDPVGTLTVSAGVCAVEPGMAGEDLVRLADRALYQAKARGRNATVLHGSE